ncbi:HipA family kinase [Nocardioides sp. NPDC058538]|uniref:HipA family kinase n=1 Tax=Nocardioides sp. NPDC058538 TaxID=3346542 RepID=UPI003664CC4D
MSLETVRVTRYVTPLREGGSLPGIVEADDLGTYVCKFRGAGQGLRVLVAEVIVTGLCRALDIPTPDQVVLDLDPEIARYEADEEVQDLLNVSAGLNLGIDFLAGAFGYDAAYAPAPSLAGRILWMDALIANVDRSWRNPNMLLWKTIGARPSGELARPLGPSERVTERSEDGALYVIDHGASLYFHHVWPGGGGDPARYAAQLYDTSEHILRAHADEAVAQNDELAARLDDAVLEKVLADVPDEWLEPVPGYDTPESLRERYVAFLRARLDGGRPWLPAAQPAQEA